MSLRRLAWAILVLGVAWSALALIDPLRPSGLLGGPLLAALGLFGLRRTGDSTRTAHVLLALALAYGLSGWLRPVFRSDAPEFFVYLPSLLGDSDLDFTNNWLALGYDQAPPRAAGGLPGNKHPVGPALVWSPFYLLAHAYVKLDAAIGSRMYEPDFHAMPYRRACALGSLTAVVLAAGLLLASLRRACGGRAGLLGLLGVLGASPILFYALVASSMSHAAAFAAAAALLWSLERLLAEGTRSAWLRAGALFGLLVLCRWQGAVAALAFLPVLVALHRRRRLAVPDLVLAALVSIAVFVPQTFVWRRLYGAFLTMPQGGGFVDWSSPHLFDTLWSSNHGLFTWTPLMFCGLLGLLWGLRRSGALCLGGLLVFAATAWVNGGVDDWAAGEAFGARRYDLALPWLALGLACWVPALERAVLRRPWLVPAAVVLLASAWNAGFAALFRERLYSGPLSIERLASHQARGLRERLQEALGLLGGPAGSALVYRALSGEYLYSEYNASGRIRLALAEEHDLRGAWSRPVKGRMGPSFRWLKPPEGCVRLPLEAPFDLPLRIQAQVPTPFGPQTVRVSVNGHPLGALALDDQWREQALAVPARSLVPGENWVCLELPRSADEQLAAAVSQLAGP